MPRLRPKRSSDSSSSRVGAGVVGSQAAAAGAQLGGFGLDDVEIFGLAEGEIAAAVDLPQLAGTNDVGRPADRLAGVGRSQRAGQGEGVGEQKVAHQDAGFVVVAGVDRFAVAAELGFVQHVVVDQRGRVDHFDHGGQGDVLVVGPAQGFGRQQQQGRPEPLSPQAEGVLDQLVDERIVARQFAPQQLFAAVQFGGDRTIQRFPATQTGFGFGDP